MNRLTDTIERPLSLRSEKLPACPPQLPIATTQSFRNANAAAIRKYAPDSDSLTQLAQERRLKDFVKKHSEFIGFPIELYVEKSKEKEVTAPSRHSHRPR